MPKRVTGDQLDSIESGADQTAPSTDKIPQMRIYANLKDDSEVAPKPKPKRGRPKGSTNKKETRAQAIARADAAEAKLAEAQPDREQLEALQGAISGTFTVAMEVWIGGKEERKPWALSGDEGEALGRLWAPVLLPYIDRAGQYGPWMVAAAGTAQVFAAKRSQVIEARMKAPETAPAKDGTDAK